LETENKKEREIVEEGGGRGDEMCPVDQGLVLIFALIAIEMN
jgi:hypothetical protein